MRRFHSGETDLWTPRGRYQRRIRPIGLRWQKHSGEHPHTRPRGLCSRRRNASCIVTRLRSNDGRRPAWVHHHLPALRAPSARADAHRRLPVLLRLYGLRRALAATAGRLLRVLLLRRHDLSAAAGLLMPRVSRSSRAPDPRRRQVRLATCRRLNPLLRREVAGRTPRC